MAIQGLRELVLSEKIKENKEVTSFYFKSKDGSKLQKHKPGQFLGFYLNVKDEKYKDVMRTYSLSIKPNEDLYRISVKRVEGGLISTYLHDSFQVGDTIKALSPMGVFTLKEDRNVPLVLISAGIGITPLISMLYEAINSEREIIFIQAVKNSEVQTFKDDINNMGKFYKNLKSVVFYSEPLEKDVLGEDYNYEGRVNTEFIKENIPLNADFYFCGPPPFMKGIYKSLTELGVSKENINYEFFGPEQDLLK